MQGARPAATIDHVGMLHAMFPDVEADTISMVLESTDGDPEAAVEALLTMCQVGGASSEPNAAGEPPRSEAGAPAARHHHRTRATRAALCRRWRRGLPHVFNRRRRTELHKGHLIDLLGGAPRLGVLVEGLAHQQPARLPRARRRLSERVERR